MPVQQGQGAQHGHRYSLGGGSGRRDEAMVREFRQKYQAPTGPASASPWSAPASNRHKRRRLEEIGHSPIVLTDNESSSPYEPSNINVSRKRRKLPWSSRGSPPAGPRTPTPRIKVRKGLLKELNRHTPPTLMNRMHVTVRKSPPPPYSRLERKPAASTSTTSDQVQAFRDDVVQHWGAQWRQAFRDIAYPLQSDFWATAAKLAKLTTGRAWVANFLVELQRPPLDSRTHCKQYWTLAQTEYEGRRRHRLLNTEPWKEIELLSATPDAAKLRGPSIYKWRSLLKADSTSSDLFLSPILSDCSPTAIKSSPMGPPPTARSKRPICIVCKQYEVPLIDPLVYCKSCRRYYHVSCHNPKILSYRGIPEVPPNWSCQRCEKRSPDSAAKSSSSLGSASRLCLVTKPLIGNSLPPQQTIHEGYENKQMVIYSRVDARKSLPHELAVRPKAGQRKDDVVHYDILLDHIEKNLVKSRPKKIPEPSSESEGSSPSYSPPPPPPPPPPRHHPPLSTTGAFARGPPSPPPPTAGKLAKMARGVCTCCGGSFSIKVDGQTLCNNESDRPDGDGWCKVSKSCAHCNASLPLMANDRKYCSVQCKDSSNRRDRRGRGVVQPELAIPRGPTRRRSPSRSRDRSRDYDYHRRDDDHVDLDELDDDLDEFTGYEDRAGEQRISGLQRSTYQSSNQYGAREGAMQREPADPRRLNCATKSAGRQRSPSPSRSESRSSSSSDYDEQDRRIYRRQEHAGHRRKHRSLSPSQIRLPSYKKTTRRKKCAKLRQDCGISSSDGELARLPSAKFGISRHGKSRQDRRRKHEVLSDTVGSGSEDHRSKGSNKKSCRDEGKRFVPEILPRRDRYDDEDADMEDAEMVNSANEGTASEGYQGPSYRRNRRVSFDGQDAPRRDSNTFLYSQPSRSYQEAPQRPASRQQAPSLEQAPRRPAPRQEAPRRHTVTSEPHRSGPHQETFRRPESRQEVSRRPGSRQEVPRHQTVASGAHGLASHQEARRGPRQDNTRRPEARQEVPQRPGSHQDSPRRQVMPSGAHRPGSRQETVRRPESRQVPQRSGSRQEAPQHQTIHSGVHHPDMRQEAIQRPFSQDPPLSGQNTLSSPSDMPRRNKNRGNEDIPFSLFGDAPEEQLDGAYDTKSEGGIDLGLDGCYDFEFDSRRYYGSRNPLIIDVDHTPDIDPPQYQKPLSHCIFLKPNYRSRKGTARDVVTYTQLVADFKALECEDDMTKEEKDYYYKSITVWHDIAPDCLFPRPSRHRKADHHPWAPGNIMSLHVHRETVPHRFYNELKGVAREVVERGLTPYGTWASPLTNYGEDMTLEDFLGLPKEMVPMVKDGELYLKEGKINPRTGVLDRQAPAYKIRRADIGVEGD